VTKIVISWSRTALLFLEPEGLIQCSWVRHCVLFEAIWILFKPSYIISIRSTLILFSHLRLHLPSNLLSPGLSIKILYEFHALFMCATYPANPILLIRHPNNVWWRTKVMKLLIVQSSPVPAISIFLKLPPPPWHGALYFLLHYSKRNILIKTRCYTLYGNLSENKC